MVHTATDWQPPGSDPNWLEPTGHTYTVEHTPKFTCLLAFPNSLILPNRRALPSQLLGSQSLLEFA